MNTDVVAGRDAGVDVEAILQRLSLREKVGQVVAAGFPGLDIPPEFTRLLQEGNLGGVILFSRNIQDPEQTAALTNALQRRALESSSGLPLLISTDQEGGVVSRLWHGATRFPGNMALGAVRDPQLAHAVGRAMGEELRAVGINFDLAPVLDVNNNPANPVIGVRSFGEDPQVVAQLGAALAQGLQEAGVAACGKHFPGHGDTAVDSHLDLPVIPHSRQRLDAVELVPFRAAIAAGIWSIMTAHVIFPAVEHEQRPATISAAVLQGLLRQELGFQGLIVTDCLEMNAIARSVGTAQGAVEAIRAGADQVLISHTLALQEEALHALLAAVDSGALPLQRLDDAVRHVLALKARLGLLAAPAKALVEEKDVGRRVGAPEHQAVAQEVARRSMTWLKPPQSGTLLPLQPQWVSAYLVVEVEPAARSMAEDKPREPGSLAEELQARLPGLVWARVPASQVEAETPRLLKQAAGKAVVVLATYNADRSPAQVALARALRRQGAQVVVVAQRSPYDLAALPEVEACLAAYSYQPVSLAAAAEVLLGDLPAPGHPPVQVIGPTPGSREDRLGRPETPSGPARGAWV
ncbi:MAG: beta-N-acetylhexosaminidase [Firmicutes bacterium]|nr:beta-N-acetylhexosaminidase [Bacillota bacterium]